MKKKKSKAVAIVLSSVLAFNFLNVSLAEDVSRSEVENSQINDNEFKNSWVGSLGEGTLCYYDLHGEKLQGLQNVDGAYYYFNEQGYAQDGWQNIDGNNYYFSKTTGIRYQNETATIDDKEYRFDSEGLVIENIGNEGTGADIKKSMPEEENVITQDSTMNMIDLQSVNGWENTENGRKYRGEDGNYYTGIHSIEGNLYSFDVDGIMQQGWIDQNNKKYYAMPDGALRVGWLSFGDTYYYCGEDGVILNGLQYLDGARYYFDDDGIKQSSKWIHVDGNKYYAMSDGTLRAGWLSFGNVYYYCSGDGAVLTGLQYLGDARYYFDDDGIKQSSKWIHADGNKYYAMSDGRLRAGWLSFGDTYYYCCGDGAVVRNMVYNIQGVCYYFNDDGIRKEKRGWQTINGEKYYGMPDGTLRIGWLSFGNTYYYCDNNGKIVTNSVKIINKICYYFNEQGVRTNKNGWQTIDGKTYYGMPDGTLRIGWLSFGDTYYYCENDGTIVKDKVKVINGSCYYFNSEGIRTKLIGWQTIDGKKYYGMPDGTLRIGWLSFGDTYYYCGEDGNVVVGFQKIMGKDYYFDSEGIRQQGWISVDNKKYYGMPDGHLYQGWLSFGNTYYFCGYSLYILENMQASIDGVLYNFDSNGIMEQESGWGSYAGEKYFKNPSTGFPYRNQWLTFGDTYYYANDNGFMARGWKIIGGRYYYFYTNSNIMARNTTIEGYRIGPDGARILDHLDTMFARAWYTSSSTNYLILVDRDAHKVAIFKGGQQNWSNVKYFDCGNGTAATPTVTGTFSVGSKGYYFDSGAARCFWYTQFYGNYLFHSVLCYKDGSVMDGRVGVAVSHGCVRLEVSNAKWIYDNIPRGTKVIVY